MGLSPAGLPPMSAVARRLRTTCWEVECAEFYVSRFSSIPITKTYGIVCTLGTQYVTPTPCRRSPAPAADFGPSLLPSVQRLRTSWQVDGKAVRPSDIEMNAQLQALSQGSMVSLGPQEMTAYRSRQIGTGRTGIAPQGQRTSSYRRMSRLISSVG